MNSTSAWLFRIARNLALNHMRDSTRHAAANEELPRHTAAASTQDTSYIVHEALAKLTPLDRDVFTLREAGGLSYDEIAQACGITADAVRARLQRARQALRVLLQGVLQQERSRGLRFTGRTDE